MNDMDEEFEFHDYSSLNVADASQENRLDMSANMTKLLKNFMPKDVTNCVIIWSTKQPDLFGAGGFGDLDENIILAIEHFLKAFKERIAFKNN